MIINKITAIILMFWPYAFVLCTLAPDEDITSVLLITYVILTLVVYTANIINAFLYSGKHKIKELALFNMLIKLIHIPFYILVFLLGILSLFMAVLPALILVTPIMIFILFVIDVLLMLTSSMYGISALLKARKAGLITGKFMAVHIVLHCFFVTDIISSIIIFINIKKSLKSQTVLNPYLL